MAISLPTFFVNVISALPGMPPAPASPKKTDVSDPQAPVSLPQPPLLFRTPPLLAKRDKKKKPPAAPAPIPLDKIDRELVRAAKHPTGEDNEKRVRVNLDFYHQWFPEKLAGAFAKARAQLEGSHIIPCWSYMVWEKENAPNREAFMVWIRTTVESWRKIFAAGNLTPNETDALLGATALTTLWLPDLTDAERTTLKTIFKEVVGWLRRPGFNSGIVTGSLNANGFNVSLRHLCGETLTQETPAATDADPWKETNPAIIYAALDRDGYFFHTPDTDREKIWKLFQTMLAAGPLPGSFATNLLIFLRTNPDYRSRLFEARAKLYAAASPANRHAFLQFFTEAFLMHEGVPEKLQAVELFVLSKLRPGEKWEEQQNLDRALVVDHFRRQANGAPDEPLLDLLAGPAVEKYLGDLPALRQLLAEEFPSKVQQWRLGFLFAEYVAVKNQRPDAPEQLIPILEEIARLTPEAIEDDALFVGLWKISGLGGEMLPERQDEKKVTMREKLIAAIADQFNTGGHGKSLSALKDFYFRHHPYAPLYRLPKGLRPTGKGFSYVAIDSIPDPKKFPHPDKQRVRIITPNRPYWFDTDKHRAELVHGFAISSLAVGDSMGLAPDASLIICPVAAENETSLPGEMAAAFEAVLAAKRDDPSIRVVGISLGLEIPETFRAILLISPLYQRLAQAAQKLYDQDALIVLSAGNVGQPGYVNMLGLLPEVRVVGAAKSQVTVARTDDQESTYTTQGGHENPIRYWAQSDPALHIIGPQSLQWNVQGGTSSAQPHVSGTLLAMLEVNPTLSVATCDKILQATADPATSNPKVLLLDPVEALVAASLLPGSTYQGERQQALARGLSVDLESFRHSDIFQKILRASKLRAE